MLIGSFADNDIGCCGGLGDFGAAKKKVVKKKTTKAKKVVAVKKAVVAKKAAVVAHAAAASIPQKVVVPKAVATRLQTALVMLGRVAKDTTLSAIKVDGALGVKSATAVNRALTKHIGPGQAAAQFRTGSLPLDFVKANAPALASLIETEILRRGGTLVPPTTAQKAALAAKAKAAKKAGAAQVAAAKALAARQKAATARAKALALRTSAAVKRQRAATLKKSSPNAASLLEQDAAQEELRALQADNTSAEQAAEAQAAAGEATSAAAATEAEAFAPTATTATGPAYESRSGAGHFGPAAESGPAAMIPDEGPPGGAPSAAEQATAIATREPPGGGGESFLSQYKWPLLGAAALALVGLGLTLTKRKPGAAPAPKAATMRGARHRRHRI